jgi:hypothetical protein
LFSPSFRASVAEDEASSRALKELFRGGK